LQCLMSTWGILNSVQQRVWVESMTNFVSAATDAEIRCGRTPQGLLCSGAATKGLLCRGERQAWAHKDRSDGKLSLARLPAICVELSEDLVEGTPSQSLRTAQLAGAHNAHGPMNE
jgi:hypothetical protein